MRQMMYKRILTAWVSLLCFVAMTQAADTRMYHCEFGLMGGAGYYVGDATPHIFMNVQEAYGAQFRYKFDKRFALQVKAQRQRVTYFSDNTNDQGVLIKNQQFYNPMWHVDVVGEYNFFRFGQREYDRRVKVITPYIFLGLGASVYNRNATLKTPNMAYPTLLGERVHHNVGWYIPLGFGMKWQIVPRLGMTLAWQHQIYFADNIEGMLSGKDDHLNDPDRLNGSNILNNDLTSTLTLGLVFSFAKEKKVCLHCIY